MKVIFKIQSQGKVNNECYIIDNNANPDEIGNKLVNWFNLTGGNSDGSYRKYIGCDLTVDDTKHYNTFEANLDKIPVEPLFKVE